MDSDITEDSYGSAPGSPAIDPAPSSRSYICQWDDCNQAHENMTSLASHVNQTHLDKKSTSKLSCEWSDCSRKGIPQTSRFALIGHVRSHTGERPFGCPVPECGRFFSRADALNKHIRTIHVKPVETDTIHAVALNGGMLPVNSDGRAVQFPEAATAASSTTTDHQLYIDANNPHTAGPLGPDYYHKIPIAPTYIFSEDIDLLKSRAVAFGGTAAKYLNKSTETGIDGEADENETDDEDLDDLDYNELRRRLVWITELKESLESELGELKLSHSAQIVDRERLLDQVLEKELAL